MILMQSKCNALKNFLSKDLQNYQPELDLISPFQDRFQAYLQKLDESILKKESEEHQKNLFCNFLRDSFPEYKNINTHERIDAVITDRDNLPRVMIETKRIGNSGEMLSEVNFNRKALHEALLYFHRLRRGSESFRLNYIMITDCEQIFLFSARQFDELHKHKNVAGCLQAYEEKSSASVEITEKLYSELGKILNSEQALELHGVCVNLRDYDYKNEEQCQTLWKILSPYSLFREPLSNDANHLNEKFYYELLHILGLKEKQDGGLEYNQDPHSMLGCTMETLKIRTKLPPESIFETAFELCILWLNRILFLKILEALLTGFSAEKFPKFLDENKIKSLSDLATLFFRVLAVKREDRAEIEKIFPSIPYLNSSLFEETETERLLSIDQVAMYHPMKVMSGSILKEKDKETRLPFLVYLIRFLNCYQFNKDAEFTNKNTVISSSVLGLVFEKLNGYRDGAHFTPARITMYMARRTIHQLILQKFNKKFNKDYQYFEQLQAWRKKLDDTDEEVRTAKKIIDGIRIFDPAVGSGHFLVSCLNELVKVKRDLWFVDDWHEYDVDIQNDELVITHINGDDFRYELKDSKINEKQQIIQKSLFETKLRIIENQLYGIDINPNSVNICRLRLWIELLKHTYYVDEQYIDLHILPNLEFRVMTANSIVREGNGEIADTQYFDILDELRLSFNQYFEAGNEDKQQLRHNIQESLAKVKDIQIGTHGAREKIAQFTPFNLSISNPFFDSELMFGVKKFDIVIGNPPYIQLQSIPKEKNPYGQEGFDSYTATGDIYQLFMERAFNWLAADGVVSLIVSNKWMLSKYGQKTREWLYKNAWVDELINLGEGWFASATVDTNIIMYRKKHKMMPNQKAIPAGYSLDEAPGGVITPDLNGSQWIIVSNKEYGILKKMRKHGTPLREWDVKINYGIKTGFNDAFIIDQTKYDELVKKDPKSKKILKRMLEGKDIRRWGYEWANLYLIGTHNGIKTKNTPAVNIDDYPAVKKHLDTYWQEIEKRQDQGDTPYNLRNCAYWKEFSKSKIVWGNLNLKPGFSLDTEGFYIFAPSNLLTLKTDDLEMLKALLAILNSKASHYFLSSIAYTRNGGYQEHKPMFVEQIPIPKAVPQMKKDLASLVDEILNKQKNNQDITELEKEIDRIVYQLYHLTDEEIAMVEEKA